MWCLPPLSNFLATSPLLTTASASRTVFPRSTGCGFSSGYETDKSRQTLRKLFFGSFVKRPRQLRFSSGYETAGKPTASRQLGQERTLVTPSPLVKGFRLVFQRRRWGSCRLPSAAVKKSRFLLFIHPPDHAANWTTKQVAAEGGEELLSVRTRCP